jgi:hypothetical protein
MTLREEQEQDIHSQGDIYEQSSQGQIWLQPDSVGVDDRAGRNGR